MIESKEYFSSINDVSTRLDVPAHTLRYWEKQFPTAIKPVTGNGGRRYYRPETVATLDVIKELLYNRGMTIMGVKKLIKEGKMPAKIDFEFDMDVPDSIPVSRPAVAPMTGVGRTEINDAIDLLQHARALLDV